MFMVTMLSGWYNVTMFTILVQHENLEKIEYYETLASLRQNIKQYKPLGSNKTIKILSECKCRQTNVFTILAVSHKPKYWVLVAAASIARFIFNIITMICGQTASYLSQNTLNSEIFQNNKMFSTIKQHICSQTISKQSNQQLNQLPAC